MANTNLQTAKAAKKDEFYTQLSDIEKELRHYKEHFRGKVVYCNCDDPLVSNFVVFFIRNFEHLGLKRLIATCYRHEELDLFGAATVSGAEGGSGKAVYMIYEGDKNHNNALDPDELDVYPLKGDGDFRSAECIELLKQADIVCTNPPFSLFREYVAQLMKYEKKFLIIGNTNAITYKEIFPLIKDNKIWLGHGFQAGNAYFSIPEDQSTNYANGVYNPETGLVKFRNCTWFTNLDHDKRHESVILFKRYNENEYPKYDNYDAININKAVDIPCDYNGEMGVPITFIDKYCPEQFEIIGMFKDHILSYGFAVGDTLFLDESHPRYNGPVVNGKAIYPRILIRRKQ